MLDSKKRIVVAMSGGVDSSVVASMMKTQGYEVIGVTLQLYDNADTSCGTRTCCSVKDTKDAKSIASSLEIPHYILNAEAKFKEAVIDDFVESYINGITPIPCAHCNRLVRIKELTNFAREIGAEIVATGHYCRTTEGVHGRELHLPHDLSKDQTHFLYGISQADLEMLRFPLQNMLKTEVRQMAEKMNLIVHKKRDSQDICFVPNGNYAEVVKKYSGFEQTGGDIIHFESHKKIGVHNGLLQYTIGQRKGIKVASAEPLYVISMDLKTNTLIVGSEKDLYYVNCVVLNKVNLFPSELTQNGSVKIDACLRALQSHVPAIATLSKDKNNNQMVTVEFLERPRAPTIGQLCTMYVGTRLIGGGLINAVISN